MDATKDALVDALSMQRDHAVGILDGLSERDLRRSVLPTGWSCLGLIQHLTADVEVFWFQEVMAGRARDRSGGEPSAWVVTEDTSAAMVLHHYQEAIALSDEIISTTPLDAAPATWPDAFDDWRLGDLRALMLHVITETACHAGHLDAARELLDGRTWVVVD